jgi:predicted metal-dependent hydrolase
VKKNTISKLIITSNNQIFNIIIRKTSRSNNISLRFNKKYSHFQLTAPNYASRGDIIKFINDSKPLIDDFLLKKSDGLKKITLEDGILLKIFDEEYILQTVASNKQNPTLAKSLIILCGSATFARSASLKLQAMLLEYASNQLAVIMQAPELASLKISPQIKLRKAQSRFGSCQPQTGRIMLSSYLIFAPKSVIDSVLFHEVAHLVHHNHSKDFWQLLSSLDPNYRLSKMWLKSHQSELFKYSL